MWKTQDVISIAMPKNCCVVDCTNNSGKRNDLSFYLIPCEATEPERREKWLQVIRRMSPSKNLWRPKSDYNYLCSSHFISGAKNNYPEHPDYVSSIFPHSASAWKVLASSDNKLDCFRRAEKRKGYSQGGTARKYLVLDSGVVEMSVDASCVTMAPCTGMIDTQHIVTATTGRPFATQKRRLQANPPMCAANPTMCATTQTGLSTPLCESELEIIYTEMDEALLKLELLGKKLEVSHLSASAVEDDDYPTSSSGSSVMELRNCICSSAIDGVGPSSLIGLDWSNLSLAFCMYNCILTTGAASTLFTKQAFQRHGPSVHVELV